MKVNDSKVWSVFKILLLALGLGTAADIAIFTLGALDALDHSFRVPFLGKFLVLFYSPSGWLLNRYLPHWFDDDDHVCRLSAGTEFLGDLIFWVLPVLLWSCFFLSVICVFRGLFNSRRKSSITGSALPN